MFFMIGKSFFLIQEAVLVKVNTHLGHIDAQKKCSCTISVHHGPLLARFICKILDWVLAPNLLHRRQREVSWVLVMKSLLEHGC